jgi:hypothetical protein
MDKIIQQHDALHVIKDLQDSIGVKGLSCFEVPKLVSGSTGFGPTKDYYTLDNVKILKDLIEQGVTIEECLTFVIAKMKISDETHDYYYVKKCIPEWLRYIAWLWEQQDGIK